MPNPRRYRYKRGTPPGGVGRVPKPFSKGYGAVPDPMTGGTIAPPGKGYREQLQRKQRRRPRAFI